MNLFKIVIYIITIYFIFCDDNILDNNEEIINNELFFIEKIQSIIDEVEIEYKFKESLTDVEKKLLEKIIEGKEDFNTIETRKIVKELIKKYEDIKKFNEIKNMTCEECQKEKKKFQEKCYQNENICNIVEDVCKEFC